MLLWLIVLIVVSGLLIWYLIFRTEGIYLGPRVVIWLYDIYARRYDNIKGFDPDAESERLAEPILHALMEIPAPLILDVATGTGRLPIALFDQPSFNGHVVGLDHSRKMLAVAAEKLASLRGRVDLVYQSALRLPFDDETFDTVTCLEALEFMPDPDAVLTEIVRVARPGALILITNRKGIDARLMPGKSRSAEQIVTTLRDRLGLEDVSIVIWQVDYDQVWAFKPGLLTPAPDHGLEAILRCPRCGQRALVRSETAPIQIMCTECTATIPIGADGVVEYDRAIGR
jgi:ubiquinone/menaquinone biosynthesis C-methylase UbiE